jgi:multidrug efflux pump subunit AcrA (membrane-fusion protein)
VIVPTEAVVSAEAEQRVYVVEPSEDGEGLVAHKVPVELGRAEEGMTEILAGLSGGEQVVIQGAYGLPDEAKVTIGGEEPSDGSP